MSDFYDKDDESILMNFINNPAITSKNSMKSIVAFHFGSSRVRQIFKGWAILMNWHLNFAGFCKFSCKKFFARLFLNNLSVCYKACKNILLVKA